MSDPIHDDEFDTSEHVVRSLFSEQCRSWVDLPLTRLRTSGTSNAVWRVHGTQFGDCAVRLPRTADAEDGVVNECRLLPALQTMSALDDFAIPELVHSGQPAEVFPMRWNALTWIDGRDAWQARDEVASDGVALASDLAKAIAALREVDDVPAPSLPPGTRGGPLGPLLEKLDRWLDDARLAPDGLVDVGAVRRCAAQSREVADERIVPGFVHRDLIAGNVLTVEGRLSAIIDWAAASYGDRSVDLTPAWSIFDGSAADVFRRELDADEASWLRGRAFALEQAVGGVLYYVPKRHALGYVMQRTLARILSSVT